LRSLAAELRAIPVVAIVIAGSCLFLALALGRAQERRASAAAETSRGGA
jgi:hypothetical protein